MRHMLRSRVDKVLYARTASDLRCPQKLAGAPPHETALTLPQAW